MINNFVFLMAPSGGESSGSSSFMSIAFFVLFFLILYFFMIRPQSKKAKEQKSFLNEKIVTIGGVHGKILKVDEDTYLIEVDTNTKVRIEKSVISLDFTKAVAARKQQS